MISKGKKVGKKKVLIITSVPFPYGTGANSNFLTNFVKGLTKLGYKFNLLIQKQPGKSTYTFQQTEYRGCGTFGVTIKFLKAPLSQIADILFPPFYLIRYRKKYNIVLTFQSDFIDNVLVVLLCKILSIPIVQILVDYYDWEAYKKSSKGGIKKKLRYLNYTMHLRFLLKFYDGGIVLSTFLHKYFMKLGFNKEQVLIQPHLVDVKNFEDAKNTPIFTNRVTSFGVLGSINHNNGITDLLLAYKLVSDKRDDVELILIGGSEEEYKYCKEIVNKYFVKGKINYIGKVHYQNLPEIFKKCDVFILPRPVTTESVAGFPTKLGEFCSSMRPIIVTNYGDIQLYFKDKDNAFLANPSDPDSLATTMFYTLDHKSEAIKIAGNGYKWAVDTIDYISGVKEIELFLRVL